MGLEKTKLNFMVAKLINKFTNWINQDGDLPFNRYAWLTTHNSYAMKGAPLHTTEVRVTFNNQEDSVTTQLKVKKVSI